ncbi:MAG: Fic family protein [Thiohalomonadales bacterium]
MEESITATPNGRYMHWDQLRHRPPPRNLNHEEWWFGVKLARTLLYKQLPLKDSGGMNFKYTITDNVLEMLHKIDSKAHGGVELDGNIVNTETRERYIINSIMEEAITSSQLEGAATTRQVAADMIRYGRQPRDTSEQMILNNYLAIRDIRKVIKEELTTNRILQLHEILTKDTLDNTDAEGRFQLPGEERVKVVDNVSQQDLHIPPPAKELSKRSQLMCKFANGKVDSNIFIHPIIKSIIIHFWLAYDHPFLDGNGRTARALFYWSMLSHGYWIFDYISISRILKDSQKKYGMSYLFSETDENDLTYFIIYQLEVIIQAIDDLSNYLEKKNKQVKRIKVMLKENSDLNHRQVALLSHAISHPGTEYTIKSHQNSHNIAYATSRSDLFELAKINLLIHRKIGQKTSVFRSPNDLEARFSIFK